MRTTVDLDLSILQELKRLGRLEGKSLGRVVSELLAQALAARKAGHPGRSTLHWISRPMGAHVDLADKEALHAALDRHARSRPAPGSTP